VFFRCCRLVTKALDAGDAGRVSDVARGLMNSLLASEFSSPAWSGFGLLETIAFLGNGKLLCLKRDDGSLIGN